MLITVVDARNVRNVMLDRTVGSIAVFKQIVGRGNSIFDGKDYFSVVNFRGETNNFYNENWDDEPEAPELGGIGEPTSRLKVKVGKNRELKVLNVETRYIDENDKPLSAIIC